MHCARCDSHKPETEFYSDESRLSRMSRFCKLCENVKRKTNKLRQKARVLFKYGGKCVCCGESEISFLTIDHINGGGEIHRRSGMSKESFAWLERNGFPDGFQILCWNCNCGRQINGGVCPHQASKDNPFRF